MDYRKYTSPGKWLEDAHKEGYMAGTPMLCAITQTMKKLEMSFAEAFSFLEETKKIFLVDKLYFTLMNYEKLFDLSKDQRALLIHVWKIIDHVSSKEKKLPKIYWQMKNNDFFDFIKSQLSDEYLSENLETPLILMTHGTQYGSPIYEIQSDDFNPKYAIVLSFSLHSHTIGERGSLYALKDGKYHRIPSVPLPNKKWAEWATKVTGKPEMEWWLQGMFLLTEIEEFSHEEAKKFMEENWDG